jgi:hypothetical protein
MAHFTCEVVYLGIFQKNLAARICRGIVLSARKAGRWGIAFGRYGDSPQRNGIPAKDFARDSPSLRGQARAEASGAWPVCVSRGRVARRTRHGASTATDRCATRSGRDTL